ncbi:MAG TPA: CAP domain-containing protein [Thermoanaerobaculia bacterium]|nr:CAP domain-containing protein [Thermoanaerobaculia bacterium]
MKRSRRKFAAAAIVALMLVASPGAMAQAHSDSTKFSLRQELLTLINRDRQQFGLAPVQLDPWVSSQADNYCRQQIRNGTTGHFTIDGLAPYARYSFAGGNDGLSENAAAWSANYSFTDRALHEMTKGSEESMMSEVAPHDGHRRTILDPFATHVGIGLAWENGEFRLTEEFVRRYLVWNGAVPRGASPDKRVPCNGRPIAGYDVDAVSVYYEPLPQPISSITANLINSYSLPDKRRDYRPQLRTYYRRNNDGSLREIREEYSDGRRGDFPVADDGSFAFSVPFPEGPGLYTVVVWVHRKGNRTPIAASNISIRVEDPSAAYLAARAAAR